MEITIKGRQDAKINGHIIDVKSASTFGFNRYVKEGITRTNDSFGYRFQLSFYAAFQDAVKTPGFFFIDKTLGKIAPVPLPLVVTKEVLRERAKILTQAAFINVEPERKDGWQVPEGKSGNMKLCTYCSYCGFKNECVPTLQGYAYANKPMWLTKVVRTPNVPKIPSPKA